VKLVTVLPNGELTQKLTVNAKAKWPRSRNIKHMTDTLATFPISHNLAREVAWKVVSGQAMSALPVRGRTHGNVNCRDNLTNQVRAIAEVATVTKAISPVDQWKPAAK